MSYFNYSGKRIYYEAHGNGETLILLHGNTVSGKFFTPVIPVFAGKYHVITLDFLGCGQSERIDKWPSDLWYEWSRQVIALCDGFFTESGKTACPPAGGTLHHLGIS